LAGGGGGGLDSTGSLFFFIYLIFILNITLVLFHLGFILITMSLAQIIQHNMTGSVRNTLETFNLLAEPVVCNSFVLFQFVCIIRNDGNTRKPLHTARVLTVKQLEIPGTSVDVILSGVMVIVFAITPKVHRFRPGQERWFATGNKNP
jgi:hypothetical protein